MGIEVDASAMRTESEPESATGKLQGGMDAAEMARRSHLARTRNKALRDAAAEEMASGLGSETVLVRVPVSTGTIIKRLAADAAKGSTQAARELRGWLSEVQQEQATDLSDLDVHTRQRLLARLLLELEAEG